MGVNVDGSKSLGMALEVLEPFCSMAGKSGASCEQRGAGALGRQAAGRLLDRAALREGQNRGKDQCAQSPFTLPAFSNPLN